MTYFDLAPADGCFFLATLLKGSSTFECLKSLVNYICVLGMLVRAIPLHVPEVPNSRLVLLPHKTCRANIRQSSITKNGFVTAALRYILLDARLNFLAELTVLNTILCASLHRVAVICTQAQTDKLFSLGLQSMQLQFDQIRERSDANVGRSDGYTKVFFQSAHELCSFHPSFQYVV